jgi:hypothetical protein
MSKAKEPDFRALLEKALDSALDCADECPACGSGLEDYRSECWVRDAEAALGRFTPQLGRKHP